MQKRKAISAADARRLQIAASVVAGRSITETAKEPGISREWASLQANAPATQQIIVSLIGEQLEHVHQLFDEALKAIQRALRARRRGLSEGEVIDLGPDHYARLAAVGRLVQILTAGRPLSKPLTHHNVLYVTLCGPGVKGFPVSLCKLSGVNLCTLFGVPFEHGSSGGTNERGPEARA
jgi:hypothetical protein